MGEVLFGKKNPDEGDYFYLRIGLGEKLFNNF